MTQDIYVISPSSATSEEGVQRGRERLRTLGFETILDASALSRHTRFAGDDQTRANAIMRAVTQPAPIVMATRGGYGLTRILPLVDWHAVAASGKRFVGHSDFTAFNLALLAQTGAVSYSGVSLVPDFGAEQPDDLTEALFMEVMADELEILSFETSDSDPVDCRGILWGGNLATLVSLIGTPYFPAIEDGILFIEDVGEHPYRVERMLTQLWHAGVLARQQAIILGEFTQYRLAPHDDGFDLSSVIAWLRDTVKVPVVTGLPYGHVPTKVTLPIGAHVGLATEDGMAYILLQEHDHEHGHDHEHDHEHDHSEHPEHSEHPAHSQSGADSRR